jgi:molecular chaperone DnaK (HSP70)
MHLGIDFGTTHSVVALSDRGNYPVILFTADDNNVYDYYPSVLADNGKELRFGFEALTLEGQSGWDIHRSFKRKLYDQESGFEQSIALRDRALPAVDVIASFLQQLQRDLRERSNLPKIAASERLRAVLGVPANAHSAARLITLEAFRRAEFDVLAMLNEPSAAGIEYAHRYRSTLTAQRENVLVYDLGGGTFDSTLVLMREKHHDVLALTLERLPGAEKLSENTRRRLKFHCREQKEKIHPNTKRILLEVGAQLDAAERTELGIAEDHACIVPADEFENACRPLVDRSLEVLAELQKEWLHGKPEAGDELSDLAGIYVVGGASALPVVARRLRDVYGRRVHRSSYPASAIAIGLAIAFDEAAGYQVTERFSRQFGVFREGLAGERVEFDVIFNGDTLLPADGSMVEVRRRYQPCHNVGHYRFVECGWLDARGVPSGDITSFASVLYPFDRELGAKDLKDVAVARRAEPFCDIEECYRVDRHGIVELTIKDVELGTEQSYRLSAERPS